MIFKVPKALVGWAMIDLDVEEPAPAVRMTVPERPG
jgi:hypothetical protein